MEKSNIKKSEDAQELYKDVVEMQKTLRRLSSALGVMLKKLKYNNVWKKAIGDGVSTWRDFLGQPEISLTEHEARFLMSLGERVAKYGNSAFDVQMNALKFVFKHEKDGENVVRELLAAAQVLPLKELKELRHDVKTDNAPRTYKYVVMKKCNETGNLSMVHTVKNEELVEHFGEKLAE
jgi:hypothetical protein